MLNWLAGSVVVIGLVFGLVAAIASHPGTMAVGAMSTLIGGALRVYVSRHEAVMEAHKHRARHQHIG
jgi:hypothetical protein